MAYHEPTATVFKQSLPRNAFKAVQWSCAYIELLTTAQLLHNHATCRLHYNTSQHRNDHLSQVWYQQQETKAT
jgi:hypothetical protein